MSLRGTDLSEATANTRTFFEERADAWDGMMPVDLADALHRMLAPFAPVLSQASRVLEIGTGTGALISHLARHVAPGRLVSIDLAHAMLAQARVHHPGTAVVQADVHNLPLVPGFDVVVCHNSFPHYGDKPGALAEFHRVLQPGGRLLILHNLPRVEVNAIHVRVGGALAGHQVPTAREMRLLLLRAGFDAVRIYDGNSRYSAQAVRP